MNDKKNTKFNKEQAVEYLEKCLKYLNENSVISFMENRSDILKMSIEALKEQIEKENNKANTVLNNDRLEIINKFIELKKYAENRVKQTEETFPFMKSSFRTDVTLYEAAISALVEQEQKEKNEPLTLEELLAKENKPVWVEHCHGGEWVVVCWDYVDRIAYSRKACLHKHDYGKEWFAYNYEITEKERWAKWK